MKTVAGAFRRFMKDEEGATLLEYGMLVLLIAVLCVVAIKAIGTKISAGFTTIESSLP
ncbi:MAG: Flp family type IVb pilin [Longimicrobiales bacterium]